VLDRPAIERLCEQIGTDSVRELAQMFFEDLVLALGSLAAAAAAQDRVVLSATAHRTKSSARALGAVALGGLLHQMEQEGPAADWLVLDGLVEQTRGVAEQTRVALTADLAGR
jgi:HPt (histidine-containing phosphotransfer) domain-containing protein